VREIPLNSERYYTHNDRDENYGTREEEEKEGEVEGNSYPPLFDSPAVI